MKTLVEFMYHPSTGRAREIVVAIEENEHGVISIKCPCCDQRSRLNARPRVVLDRENHEVTIPGHRVLLSKRGLVTVTRPIICPNPSCGWFVRVKSGMAFDAVAADDVRPGLPTVPHVEEVVTSRPTTVQAVLRLTAPGGYRETMELF